MSTCNFRQPQLDRIYSIGLEVDQNDIDDFLFEDTESNINYDLEKIKGYSQEVGDKWLDRGRSKLGGFLLEIYDHEQKEWASAYLYVTAESGYYQGAMFDMDFSELENYKLSKTTQAKVDSIKKRVQKILSNYCLPIRRVAVFSNGEAIYKRA